MESYYKGNYKGQNLQQWMDDRFRFQDILDQKNASG